MPLADLHGLLWGSPSISLGVKRKSRPNSVSTRAVNQCGGVFRKEPIELFKKLRGEIRDARNRQVDEGKASRLCLGRLVATELSRAAKIDDPLHTPLSKGCQGLCFYGPTDRSVFVDPSAVHHPGEIRQHELHRGWLNRSRNRNHLRFRHRTF